MDSCRSVKISRGSNCFFGENDDIDCTLKSMNSIYNGNSTFIKRFQLCSWLCLWSAILKVTREFNSSTFNKWWYLPSNLANSWLLAGWHHKQHFELCIGLIAVSLWRCKTGNTQNFCRKKLSALLLTSTHSCMPMKT